MTGPLDVSVVIPVHNGARYLAAAIESVLGQSHPPQAIIVVDDGSSDSSAQIAAGFEPRVTCLRRPQAGAAAARNAGQVAVRTPLLAFLDADDLWQPRKLEWQLAALAAATGPAMVFGHAEQFISPDLDARERAELRCETAPMPAYCCSSLLMANSDFAAVGGFNASLPVGEFVEWFARAKTARLAPLMLPQTVFRRRVHRSNMGRSAEHSRAGFAKAMKMVLDAKRANG
jgi:glycosyltransferase involved in cell wall biosynthesis